MAGEKSRGGKKGRKIGRNARNCEQYRKEGRREKNKVKRLRRHLNRKTGSKAKGTQRLLHASDIQAQSALKRLAG